MAIKYRYVKTPNGEYVDIHDENVENRRNMEFFCISCDCGMVASLGDKAHHFLHKVEQTCDKDKYLHELGENIFIKTYKECIEQGKPYKITLQRRVPRSLESTCVIKKSNEELSCLSFEKEEFDLTMFYQSIEKEKNVDQFRPDVFLKSDDPNIRQIFIEI